jgi:hypothetical protein
MSDMQNSKKFVMLLLYWIVAELSIFSGQVAAQNVEQKVLAFFKDTGADLICGRGTFLHYTFKNAFDFDEFTGGITFASEEHKKRFVSLMAAQFGVDFSLKAPFEKYEVWRLYYDGEKVRKEVSEEIDESVIKSLYGGSLSWTEVKDKIPFAKYIYDGSKTVGIHDGGRFSSEPEVAITQSKIWTPDFRAFGRNNSGKDTAIFTDAINKGDYELSSRETAEGYLAAVSLKKMGIRLEMLFDKDVSSVPRRIGLYTGPNLAAETIYGPYIKSPNGTWYPSSICETKYVQIGEKSVMSYKDEYVLLDKDVDFNCEIPPETFVAKIPVGAHILDYTKGSAKPFPVESVDLSKLAEEPSKVRIASSTGPGSPRQSFAGAQPLVAENRAPTQENSGRSNEPRTWWQEWGLAALILVVFFGFVTVMLIMKRKKMRKR